MKTHQNKEIKIYLHKFGLYDQDGCLDIYIDIKEKKKKTFQKSSPEPMGRLQWNLICSILDSGQS